MGVCRLSLLSSGRVGTIRLLIRRSKMTYEKIFRLKFNEELPTHELRKLYPKEQKKISRVALLELPTAILRELVKREKELQKLISLKKWLLGKENLKKKKAVH